MPPNTALTTSQSSPNKKAAPAASSSSLTMDEEAVALVPRSAPPTAMNVEIPASAVAAVSHTPTNVLLRTFWDEIWQSTELLFQSKLTWLLLFGPIAVIGDSTGIIGEAACFTCAGLALIPCAERCVDLGLVLCCLWYLPPLLLEGSACAAICQHQECLLDFCLSWLHSLLSLFYLFK